jgi:3-methyladenine DNA glycosylase/8-oxoguanine DNA glycosylase
LPPYSSIVEERSGNLLAQAPPPARSSPAAGAPQYGEVTDATPPMAAPGPDHCDPGRALAELRDADPVLAALIDESGPLDVAAWRERWSQGRFESLARGIVGQQISTGAATAIYGLRHAVQALYHLDHVPSPGEVEDIGERWRPNRTLATAYLYEAMWRGRIPERGR